MSNDAKEVALRASLDGGGVASGAESIRQDLRGIATTATQVGQQAAKAVDAIGDSADKSAAQAARAYGRFEAEIRRVTAATQAQIEGSGKAGEILNRAIGQGLDPARFEPALQKLRELEAAQTAAAASAKAQAAEQRDLASSQAQISSAQQAYLQGLRDQIALYGRSADEVARMKAAQLGVGAQAAPLLLQLQNQRAAQEAAAEAARQEAAAQREAAAAKKAADAAAASFLKNLQDEVATQGLSRQELLRYRATQLGVTKEAEALIGKIEASAGGLNKMGVSAAQTAAALRGVPAQLTDIVTSLQGGQAPLTVLLQQGGQLKDMFGGVGNAVRALGSYLLGLVNPFTVAATAAGVLAYAYTAGAGEGEQFRKTIILSGNAAGVTGAQLSTMAAAIGAIGGATQGKAAEVLAQIAATGAVGADNLQRFTAAAIALERAGGPAASETAKAFAELAKSPLQAATKLNEGTNFLTSSLYQQIRALEEQGRTLDAARLAQTAYYDVVAGRAPQLAANLGTVERAWQTMGDAAKRAWDKVLNIGRESTPAQLTAGLQEQIATLQRQIDGNGFATTGGGAATGGGLSPAARAAAQAQLAALQEQQRLLDRSQVSAEAAAAAERERAKATEATAVWLKAEDQFLSRAEQMQKAITRATNEGAAAVAAGAATQEEVAKRIALIRQQFDPGVNIQNIKDAEAQRLLLVQRSEDQIALLRARGALGEREAIERQTELTLQGIAVRRQAAVAELAIVSAQQNKERETAALKGQIAQLDTEAINAQKKGAAELDIFLTNQRNRAFSETRAQREQQAQELADADRLQNEALRALTVTQKDYAQTVADEAERLALETSLLTASAEARAARLAQFQNELTVRKQLRDIDAAPIGDDDRERLRSQARATQAKADAQASSRAFLDEWQKTADSINQSLTDALLKGFDDGKGFAQNLADSVKNIFKTLILRPIIQAIVQPIAGNVAQLVLGQQQASGTMQGLQSAQALQTLYGYGAAAYKAGTAAYGFLTGSGGTVATGATNAALAESAVGTAGYGASSAGAGGASAAGGTGVAASTWAAAIIAGIYKANDDYNKGYNVAGARKVGNETGGLAGTFETFQAGLLKGLGFSDRLSSLLSGSTAVAALIGRAAPQIQQQGVQGTLTAGDFTGQAFADIKEKGGLFRSDKNYTVTQTLDESLQAFFGTAAKSVYDKAQEYGKALGLPVDALSQVSTDIKIALGDDAEANKKAITDALSGYGDALVAGFKDILKPLALYGESVTTTIERVAGSIAQVNGVLQTLGLTALQASVDGGKAAIAISDAFGGLEAFGTATGSYFSNYYSEAEKTAKATESITKQLAAVGLQLPSTRDEFRKLVTGLDLTTATGQQQFAALMMVQQQFADITATATDNVKTLADAWSSTFDSIHAEIDRLRGIDMKASTPATLAQAQAQFTIANAQARAGDKTAADKLPELSKALLALAQDNTSSAADLARIRALTANTLETTLAKLNAPDATTTATAPSTTVTTPTATAAAATTAAQTAAAASADLLTEIKGARSELQAAAIHLADIKARAKDWTDRGLLVRTDTDPLLTKATA